MNGPDESESPRKDAAGKSAREFDPDAAWMEEFSSFAVLFAIFGFVPIASVIGLILGIGVLLHKESGFEKQKKRALKAVIICAGWMVLGALAYLAGLWPFRYIILTLFIFLVAGAVGVICTAIYLAFVRITEANKERKEAKAVLVGKIISAAVLLGLFSGMMYYFCPHEMFAPPRRGRTVPACMSNLKQIGLAIHLYTQSFNGYLPPDFEVLVPAFLSDPKTLRCPHRKEKDIVVTSSDYYCEDVFRLRIDGDGLPPDTILAYDLPGNHADESGKTLVYHVLFLDAHVEPMPANKFRGALQRQRKMLKKEQQSKK